MNHLQHIEHKVMEPERLIQQLSKWRDQDCRIVFTNGCFDLLHRGHVDYLARAADFGDKLIIGLNTDASVRRLKGEHRPINDETSRALLLAALGFVSAVVLFDEPTPLELIRTVQPDVLIKGADYTPESIVGYDIVTARGGRVEVIPFLDGYSTTGIEQRIRGKM
ncbi:MAG: D-glycero-beta-D-manno-heptose 1-phosphate adenylyltransferase [Sphingobacteriales bacterium]|jgi:rfaE bifunctional protein nucleotidyltransferase chain/domain|nr:D-glycero-beta-D-manno-heptose 1-phosphate adenylyltransferase [Sphingobacteriales bacterium]